MTSNVGSQYILNTDDDTVPKELAYETIKHRVMDAARSIFRPNFMNRVDDYILFQPLDHDQISSIVRLQFQPNGILAITYLVSKLLGKKPLNFMKSSGKQDL
ncbi:hypothetical protein RIF29_19421 [Crotalaria pallida]|uniref:Uncharacterized protein n=1 Tax=Crotalaria pallida TaxID=3830 RepID=A0AAN9F0P4_CROPI